MKKAISSVICILLLLTYTAGCFADNDKLAKLFTLEIFIETLDNIDYIINSVCAFEDGETIESILSYLQLAYVEGDDSSLWYDNQDWLIELTAYFDSGGADVFGHAYTITRSFPAEEEYTL